MGMIVFWPVLARIEDFSGYRYAGATSYLMTRVPVSESESASESVHPCLPFPLTHLDW